MSEKLESPTSPLNKYLDRLALIKDPVQREKVIAGLRKLSAPVDEQLNEGIKSDADKTPLGLLSTIWLFGVGDVLKFGAQKYAAHNWRKGIAQSRLIDAALRHLLAYNQGEDNDPESGLSHLYHASCCLMFPSELAVTRPDLDDRYKIFVPK